MSEPRASETSEQVEHGEHGERLAERAAAAGFGVTVLACAGLAYVYYRGGQAQLEGLLLAVAFGGLAYGFVTWGQKLLPQGPVAEDRHELPSTEPERERFEADLERGGVISRRRLLKRIGVGAAVAGLFLLLAANFLFGFNFEIFGIQLEQNQVQGFWYGLIAYFLYNAASQSLQQERITSVIGGAKVAQLMTTDFRSTTSGTTVASLIRDVVLPLNLRAIPVLAGDRFLGLVDRVVTRMARGVGRGRRRSPGGRSRSRRLHIHARAAAHARLHLGFLALDGL